MDIQQLLNSGILEKYVLGLATHEEMEQVERFAKDYPEVNAQICKMQNCMEEYAEMHAIRPPKHLKERIINKIDGGEVAQNSASGDTVRYMVPPNWRIGAAVAAVMILSLSFLSMMLYQNQRDTFDELALLSTQVKHLQQDQEALQVSNKQIVQRYSVLKDVTTQKVNLKGSTNAPQALAVVYWNSSHNKGYLNVVDLPKCPNGHEYQMWADVNGKHVNMGMLKMSDTGAVLHNLPYIPDSRGFVITLEKAGGSPHPSTNMIYANGEM